MTPFHFNPITSATSHKSFVRLPKERPALSCASLSLDKLEDRLEAPSGADA